MAVPQSLQHLEGEELEAALQQRKIDKMAHELGISAEEARAIVERGERGASEPAAPAAPAANPFAKFMQQQNAAAAAAAAASAPTNEKVVPGRVLICGGVDWDRIGGKDKAIARGDLLSPHKMLGFSRKVRNVFSGSCAFHTIAVDEAGAVFSWGRNDSGQLGCGDLTSRSEPVQLPASGFEGGAVVGASCGKQHTLVWTAGGSLYGFGTTKMGQLGLGTTREAPVLKPQRVPWEAGAVVKAACGENWSALVDDNGSLATCGMPEYGQLGTGTTGVYIAKAGKEEYNHVTRFEQLTAFVEKEPRAQMSGSSRPEPIPHTTLRFTDVAAGKSHGLALTDKSQLFSWGFGAYGRLGHQCADDELVPRLMWTTRALPPHMKYTKIAAGGSHCVALSSPGQTYWWGKLPNTSRGEAQTYPTTLDLGQFKMLCCAAGHANILTAAESVTVTQGIGDPHGSLGHGEGQPKNSGPVKFCEALDGVMIKDVACGNCHSVMISADEDKDDRELLDKMPAYDPAAEPAESAGGGYVEPAPAKAKGKGPAKKKAKTK